MHEIEVAEQLEGSGIDLIVSLPCDKNKGFTDLVHERFRVIDITREEDGVGICAGAVLAGSRPVMSIQSSGLGNMLNAMLSLTDCYKLPLVVLASWRGVDDEKIEAQKPFNIPIPDLLKVYGIECMDLDDPADIGSMSERIDSAFDRGVMLVVLIHPRMWGKSERLECGYPSRTRRISVNIEKTVPEPSMTRLEAIAAVMSAVDDQAVVSNIGVPSKEVFASKDRPGNFYMLGSYTQATPIGLGIALCSDKDVIVIDGDGSLLGSSIFPVLSQYRPDNLKVVCMDNGTFGSTGHQVNAAYDYVDMGTVATGYGLPSETVDTAEGIRDALDKDGFGFVQAMIVPGNSASPNIPMTAAEIRDRFEGFFH